MFPGENEADKLTGGSSSNWMSSLPPPSQMIPFPTCDPAESPHFRPVVPTQPSSQVYSFPMSASPMFPATSWTPYASYSHDSLWMKIPSSSSSLGGSLNLVPSLSNLQSQVSPTHFVGWNGNPLSPSPYSSQPPPFNWNPQGQVSSTHFVGWNGTAFSRGPYSSQPPPFNWNPEGQVSSTDVVGWNENSFNCGLYSSQPTSSNWNPQGQIPSTNSVGWNTNALSCDSHTSQPSSSTWNPQGQTPFTNSVGWNTNALSCDSNTSQPSSSTWNPQGQIPSTNSVGWNRNALSCDSHTSQPASSNWNLPYISSTNSVGCNENASSFQFKSGCDTSKGLKKITASTKQIELVTDPKKMKRILANRDSAARSNEKKLLYKTNLEERVKVLENEIASKCSKISILEKQNEEMRNACDQLKNEDQTNEQNQTQIELIEHLIAESEMHNVDQSNEQ